eukprot:CAMPEP_0174759824 /NCGR_PEP_ID=MMETSP1094-20130205/108464_1 /TAXON_ID=156173 /ORGANISM="Chrysochromulina brevifilum, Strain UTEX LB 985" /LENGTH=326 /DNA_ID=CAMNT_0015965765 /DNA_START=49 /DNA_END=1029 /DNA_ORIENTATION=-
MRVPAGILFPLSNAVCILRGASPSPAPATAAMLRRSNTSPTSKQQGRSIWVDVAARYMRLTTYAVLAYVTYVVIPHPGLQAVEWRSGWVSLVLVRNLTLTLGIYAGWHHLLYESAATRLDKACKYSTSNLLADGTLDPTKGYDPARDRRLTFVGVLIASAFECLMLHMWATKSLPSYDNLSSRPQRSLLLLLVIPYWSDVHFFAIHRLIHPWRLPYGLPDPGHLLYRHVHSVHHKAYNPGPWSGLAMHPIEHALFFSSILVPFQQHPLHLYVGLFYKLIAPLAGHDGYESPAGDGYFHFLHHKYFECNYGSPAVPLDMLFGTLRQQ